MQTEAPEVFGVRKGSQATLELYGEGTTARVAACRRCGWPKKGCGWFRSTMQAETRWMPTAISWLTR